MSSTPLRGVIVSHAAVAEALVTAVKTITGLGDALTPVSNDGCGTEDLAEFVLSHVLRKKELEVLNNCAVIETSGCHVANLPSHQLAALLISHVPEVFGGDWPSCCCHC